MKVITAPELLPPPGHFGPSMVFLAGSIEMGVADEWQQAVIHDLGSYYNDEQLIIFNPRRDDFDASQEQSINNDYFKKQVEWELDALDRTDYVLLYLQPDTKSPITLLELGLTADSICKLVVVCPDGFYRKGNIEVICDRFEIPLYTDLQDGITEICRYINVDQHIVDEEISSQGIHD